MKSSTKTLIIGIVVVILAVIVASWIVNIALAFLGAVIKFVLIAGVALVLIVAAWAWWSRSRAND